MYQVTARLQSWSWEEADSATIARIMQLHADAGQDEDAKDEEEAASCGARHLKAHSELVITRQSQSYGEATDSRELRTSANLSYLEVALTSPC